MDLYITTFESIAVLLGLAKKAVKNTYKIYCCQYKRGYFKTRMDISGNSSCLLTFVFLFNSFFFFYFVITITT